MLELTAQVKPIGSTTFRFFDIFLIIALIYLLSTSVVARLLDLEAKTCIPGLTSGRL